jgi:hypothetical protein
MSIIYRFLVDNSYGQYDLKIERAIQIMNEYGLFNDSATITDDFIMGESEEPIAFKHVDGDKVVYNIFFENLHIKIKKVGEDIIYSIYIKKTADSWSFKGKDFSHPLNETYRVYIWYNVSILDVTRTNGSAYQHGNWDKYVYHTFKKFSEWVTGHTDKAKFNEDYKN